MDSFLRHSLEVLDTSEYTQWRPSRWPEDGVHRTGGGPPRCHSHDARALGQGNVCTVVARARFEYGRVCSRPVTFSLWQAVSQVSRQQPMAYFPGDRPEDFNASRRLPVPDGLDARYDMCEARVCSGDDGCQPLSVQNDAVAGAVNVSVTLTSGTAPGVLESECRFEVFGFHDDLWSPWIYFRQAVGYEIHS